MTSREHADAVIARFAEACAADERIVAAFLGGSRARGEDDGFSDIDACVIVEDHAHAEFKSEMGGFVRRIGEPLFLEHFGNERIVFVIFADGTDLELHVVPRDDIGSIRSGPHRVLLDEQGILRGLEFPMSELDTDAQTDHLRRILLWFWHDVGHFTTAIGRGQLWWAAGQLEQLRNACVSLVRIDQSVAVDEEPYWKLDIEVSTDQLEALRPTFVPIERNELLRAGRDVVAFFRRTATDLASRTGLAYPSELDAVVSRHLEGLDPGPR